MKRILSFAVMALLAVAAWSAERAYNLKSTVHELQVTSDAEVDYVPSAGEVKIVVNGPDKNMGNVMITCNAGVLRVASKHKESRKGSLRIFDLFGLRRGNLLKDVKITLYAPPIATYRVDAGAELKVKSLVALPGREVSVAVSGAADVEFKDIECGAFKCFVSSAADVEIDGLTAVDASFEASSAADLEAKGLNVTSVKAVASSAAEISLAGRANVADLEASSAGSVKSRRLMTGDKRKRSSSAGSVR